MVQVPPQASFGGGRFPGTVCAVRSPSYDPAAVAAAVRRLLEPFGGAAGIAGERRRVLLKPNVLRPALPEEAVTTHPEVVRALAREFLACGCEVAVGDSPGGNPGPASPAFEKSGIAAVARELDIPLLNFQKEGSVEVALPYSPVRLVRIAKPVLEAQTIINLPKLKTHTLTQITCALKNPYGCIPGFLKGILHTRAPRVAEFVQLICALWAVVPPAFSVLDGIVGMQGDGPSGGTPYPAGWLLAGSDPVAMDTLAAEAMGFDPVRVTVLREAVRRGLGEGDPGRIRLLGAERGALTLAGFVLPSTSLLARMVPRCLLGPLGALARRLFWVRPHVVPERCERCLRCVRSCPTGAMQAETGEAPRLALPRACISCLCCQEICPAKAIETRKSFCATRAFRPHEGEEEALEEDRAGP